MGTHWTRFYQEQMESKKVRAIVEKELESLRLGVQIARLRDQQGLTQARLAARAGISSPKISAIENKPRNITVATLVRLARALDRRVEIRFLPHDRQKQARSRRSEPKSKQTTG